MRIKISSIFIISLIFLVTYPVSISAQSYNIQWATRIGGEKDDYVNSIVCHSNNKIYVTGGFVGSIYSGTTSANGYGMRDIFFACYNSDGTVEWIKTFGSVSADNATHLAVVDTCVYMIGSLYGNAQQDNDTFEGEGSSLFIASWSLDGKINWLKRFSYSAICTNNMLEVNAKGQIVIGGILSGILDVEGSILNSLGKRRAYGLILSGNGELINSYLSEGSGEHEFISVAFDEQDNGYYLFGTTGTFGIGGNSELFQSISGKSGLILAKCLDLDNPEWLKFIEADDYFEGIGVESPGAGAIICTNFRKNLNLGNTKLSTGSTRTSVALAQYSEEGQLIWGEAIQGYPHCRAMDMIVDQSRNVLVTGSYYTEYKVNDINIEGDNSGGNTFLIQFNQKGEGTWHDEIIGGAANFSKSFALDPGGNIYITGGYADTLEIADQIFDIEGSKDVYLAKYFNCNQLETQISDPGPLCSGEEVELTSSGDFSSRLWNNTEWGDTYFVNNPGFYYVSAYNDFGCIAYDTIEIHEAEVEDLGLPEEISLSPDEEKTLQANAGFVSYRWSDGTQGDINNLSYTTSFDSLLLILTAISVDGCEATDSVLIRYLENDPESDFHVFPNPVEEDLFWKLDDDYEELSVVLTLTGIKGDLIYDQKYSNYLPGTIQKFNMYNLASACYLITVTYNNNVISKRIIKK